MCPWEHLIPAHWIYPWTSAKPPLCLPGILLSLTKANPSQRFFNIKQCSTECGLLNTIYKKPQNHSWGDHLRSSPAAKVDFIIFFASTHSPTRKLKYGIGPGNNLQQNKRTRIFAHQYKLNERHTKHHKESHEQRSILCTQQAKCSYFVQCLAAQLWSKMFEV